MLNSLQFDRCQGVGKAFAIEARTAQLREEKYQTQVECLLIKTLSNCVFL